MLRKINFWKPVLVCATLCVVSTFCGNTLADTFTTTRNQPVVETDHRVTISIEDGYAKITVKRTFFNKGSTPDQIDLGIDLPARTAAVGLRIKGEKEWYNGILMEARMADVAYESLTGFGPWRLKDPALLYWINNDQLQLLLFPALPKRTTVVEYTLLQSLPYGNGYLVEYPRGGLDPKLTSPRIAVVSTGGPAKISMDGYPMRIGEYQSVDADCLEESDYKLDWSESNRTVSMESCLNNSYNDFDCIQTTNVCCAQIEVFKKGIDTVDARYGVFSFRSGKQAVRLEIDGAPQFRSNPKNASVVFVIDGSRSLGSNGARSAFAFAQAFVDHLGDASFETILFDRIPRRLFGKFLKGKKTRSALKNEIVNLELQNGSELGEALVMAARTLTDRKGPKRIIVITDTLMKSKFDHEETLRNLDSLGKDVILHIAELPAQLETENEVDKKQATAIRNNDHILSPIPDSHGGILLSVSPQDTQTEHFLSASLELVRPLRIDDFRILFEDDVRPFLHTDGVLEEGNGLRSFDIEESVNDVPKYLQISGKLWTEDISIFVEQDALFGADRVSSMIFPFELYPVLSWNDQMQAAVAGKVVSPVTSYLSVEPGTRPSREGLVDGLSTIGHGGGGSGSGYGRGCGMLSGSRSVDWRKTLESEITDGTAHCFSSTDDKRHKETFVELYIETIFNEIVDVRSRP